MDNDNWMKKYEETKRELEKERAKNAATPQQTVVHHHHTTPAPNNSGDFLISAAVGAATGSALLGGLVGGDMLGGIVGDLFDGDLFD